MSKELVISANPHETRVAILEEGQLCEYYVEREKEFALVGSIYKGRVTRVLPGMQSAFVEIGLDSDAFLYVSDFLEDLEEFDHIVTTSDEKIQKMQDQGGQALPPPGTSIPALEPSDVEPAPHGATAEPQGAESHAPQTESFAAPIAQAPSAPPSSHSHSQNRGPINNRPRGGRDFGRRGPGGRHGRPGRGGGRGGDRHFGRDLPSSKYASSHTHEDYPADATQPAEGHVSIILPGESFAKYKEKLPVAPAAESQEPHAGQISDSATEHIPAAAPLEPAHEAPAAPRREHQQSSFSGGLEPLPGESLSKWKAYAQAPAEPVAPAETAHEEAPDHAREEFHAHEDPAPVFPAPSFDKAAESHEYPGSPLPFESLEPPEIFEAHAAQALDELHGPELHDAEFAHEEPHPDGLTEEEAISLAEQIAEAQGDEAARDERDRSFAAADEAELEAAEAEAEEEGMIAPPEEGEHADAEALAAEAALHTEDSGQPAGEPQPFAARVRNDFRARMQHPARRGGGGGRDRGRRDDRGRRPHHGQGSHAHGGHRIQPRRPQLIADMLKQGQEIIVQIAKEPLGKKGARITSHVALPGRYLVYMPTLDHTGVSRKIASAEERARLRHLVNDAKGSAGGGFIVRTAAASAPPEDVRTDVEFLTRTWAEVKARSEQRKAPSLLHRDLNLVERILRDYVTPEYAAIWVDSEEEYTKVVDFVSRFQPVLVNRVKLYTKETPVFEEFGIQQEIDKGLRPKVWLKSGGYIVINHTEALVAIDVNTGKFVGKGSNRLEDTIVRTNLEAVKEIVRQMRLRDLGGIIIIDFIDMEERRNREKVMAALEDALRADRAPSKVLRFNEFGLVAITRKRTKQALERTLCQPCPYCTGSGMVKSIPTLCYEIQTEARKMAPDMPSGSLTLRVHPEISKALKTRESSLIEELERWTKKSVIIQADPTLHWEQYDIY
ncbi:MAG: Rne/Rng family ribonuclease [Candidatus Acidiferrales bacterium]